MSEWRPEEGWEEIKERYRQRAHSEDWDREEIFEAGADAIVAALRESSGRHHISPSDNDIPCKLPELWPGQTGYVVFIPDEKV